MKIRNGFVTNSSSSSFLALKIKSNKLSEIFEIYKLYDGFDYECSSIDIDDNGTITYREDESCWYECPSNLLDAINLIIEIINGSNDLYIHEDESENSEINIEEYEIENKALRNQIAAAIFRNHNEILADVEMVEIECADIGYGGDDETRYNKDSYSDDTLQSIYEDIAEKLNKPMQDITDDDFDNYVGDKTSIAEEIFKFTRVNGEENIEISSNYYLE